MSGDERRALYEALCLWVGILIDRGHIRTGVMLSYHLKLALQEAYGP